MFMNDFIPNNILTAEVINPEYNQLKPMEKYRITQMIGSGAYSQVFKAIDITTGKQVAIKEMRLNQTNNSANKVMMRQIKLLGAISNHPNIVKMIEFFWKKASLCLVLQYLPMDLITYYKYIRQKEKRSLTDSQITHIFKQICQGIAFLHSKRIMHRDIKPQNVLINPNTHQVKLIDFGFAKHITAQNNTNYMITRWYRPLEVVLGMPYDQKVDIFSLGALLLELYNQKEIFRSSSNIDQLYWIVNICGFPHWKPAINKIKQLNIQIPDNPPNLPKLMKRCRQDAKDLINSMLHSLPFCRKTIFQILQHPYFNILTTTNSPTFSNIQTGPTTPKNYKQKMYQMQKHTKQSRLSQLDIKNPQISLSKERLSHHQSINQKKRNISVSLMKIKAQNMMQHLKLKHNKNQQNQKYKSYYKANQNTSPVKGSQSNKSQLLHRSMNKLQLHDQKQSKIPGKHSLEKQTNSSNNRVLDNLNERPKVQQRSNGGMFAKLKRLINQSREQATRHSNNYKEVIHSKDRAFLNPSNFIRK